AYWANQLQAGETTSYLLDAAQMTAAADNIPGEYYYGIHVDGQLISPDRINDFLAADPDYTHHADLSDFLTAVQNGSIDNNWGNPGPDDDVQPDQINFSIMAPGTIFTMAGEQYRYLENMGNRNHMIIRNSVFRNVSFPNTVQRLTDYYNNLDSSVQSMIQPVSIPSPAPNVAYEDIIFTGNRWIPTNLHDFPDVATDVTQVDSSGSPQAFVLSLADVARLSGPGRAFPNHAERGLPVDDTWAWLRTPGAHPGYMWSVLANGTVTGFRDVNHNVWWGGLRPALIVRQ
ncbi:hypothetical protein AALA58_07540, partial [Lactococcus ileimucosae]